MIDMIYLAVADDVTPVVVEQRTTAMQQKGMVHSKVAGRFEIVKELPKEADNFDNMFTYADAFGKFRLAYINNVHEISSQPDKVESHATAFGGQFGIKTAELHGLQATITAYISQGLNFVNPDKKDLNEAFFVKDLNSFAYIAEASINYNTSMFQTKIGRVRIETPYANSDDIRMSPNTFEGAWANVNYSDSLNTQLLYFSKWAGYGSQDEEANQYQNKFKDLVSDDAFGMLGTSLTYKCAKNSELSFWYNYIDEMSAIAYAEIIGVYFIYGEEFYLDYGLQASNISELDNSNIDGNVLGTMAILHYEGAFLGAAYNLALSDKGKYITDGFGGGPYYTSLDEATISAISEAAANVDKSVSNNNAEAYRIATGYEFDNNFVNGLMLEVVYGKLYNDNGSIIEKDAILTYDITDRWYLEATYTNFKSSCNNNTFDRALARLDYTF